MKTFIGVRKKVLPNDHLITDDKIGKVVKGTSQCYVPPHAQVGSKHCQHLEKVINKSPPPLSSDYLNLQTKPRHKSIQTFCKSAKLMCSTFVTRELGVSLGSDGSP